MKLLSRGPESSLLKYYIIINLHLYDSLICVFFFYLEDLGLCMFGASHMLLY